MSKSLPVPKQRYFSIVCILFLAFVTIRPVHSQSATPTNAPIIPVFIGNPAIPKPIPAKAIPQNPSMATNGRSNMHNDTYMSDTYTVAGPVGKNPKVTALKIGEDCPSITFDQKGRVVALCLSLKSGHLYLLEPSTLNVITSMELPTKEVKSTIDFPAGSYFYFDREEHAIIPTVERTIWQVGIAESEPKFERQRVYDLTRVVPEDDSIGSVLPDFSGMLWFVTKGGIVGTINRNSGAATSIRIEGEAITNSFALDETGGVFIASDHAIYRFDASPEGKPVITWREAYDRGSKYKPGQVTQGTGTTPTLMGADYVTITDNADPQMHVLVYRRAAKGTGARLVCSVAVFAPNQGATENSLIATEKSIIVENNYGYGSPLSTILGRSSQPGITRIDLDDSGSCNTVWTSAERVPNVVSKLSLVTGLLYSYTKDEGPGTADPWYFTAIDFETGKTVFKQLTGMGTNFNSHYAGLYLAPDGTAYVGVVQGMVAIKDQP